MAEAKARRKTWVDARWVTSTLFMVAFAAIGAAYAATAIPGRTSPVWISAASWPVAITSVATLTWLTYRKAKRRYG
jgi:hypothetical protein